MVFVHIEENEVLRLDRMETLKGVRQVIADIENEHGKPLEVKEGEKSTRVKYDGWCAFITRI